MGYTKYIYDNGTEKFVIEEDIVGWYLIVYQNHSSKKSTEDYLLDSLEMAMEEARYRFGIKENQWELSRD